MRISAAGSGAAGITRGTAGAVAARPRSSSAASQGGSYAQLAPSIGLGGARLGACGLGRTPWTPMRGSHLIAAAAATELAPAPTPPDADLHRRLAQTCMQHIGAWTGLPAPQTQPSFLKLKERPEWTLALMTVSATSPRDGQPCFLLCATVYAPGLTRPLPGATGEQLSGLLMHWGCSRTATSSWKPPPAGWHTSPPVSLDGGENSRAQTSVHVSSPQPPPGLLDPSSFLLSP